MIFFRKQISYLLELELGIKKIKELYYTNFFHIFSYIFVINYYYIIIFNVIFERRSHRQNKLKFNKKKCCIFLITSNLNLKLLAPKNVIKLSLLMGSCTTHIYIYIYIYITGLEQWIRATAYMSIAYMCLDIKYTQISYSMIVLFDIII